MSDVNRDLFPTSRINVPNLVPLMERLRDEALKRSVTLLHVASFEEGEWICSTASARLSREHVPHLAPQDGKVIDLVEQAIRSKIPIVFVGEIRREEDARALRAAATLGVRTVGFLVRESRHGAEDTIAMLGSWSSFDVALLSEYPA
jgi:2-succinyl-5-enolpyruvyl-6-hydroxy-3-cyclohexene-1-carboxylate synthase